MPELPDVEATRRYLVSVGLPGRRFTGVETLWPGAIRTPSLEEFVLTIKGQAIGEIGRRAKFLLISLRSNWTLVLHMRMTGYLLVERGESPRPAMTRNVFELDDGRELRFVDPRKLGQVWLVDDTRPLLGKLGPEPLDYSFSPDVLSKQLAGRHAPVKALLCDQEVIAGIGNIYADEALFVAGINPLKPASDLSTGKVEKMHRAIVDVLGGAVETLSQVMPRMGPPTETERGSNQLRVSRHKGGTCSRCGAMILRVPVRGRSTYYCPACQV